MKTWILLALIVSLIGMTGSAQALTNLTINTFDEDSLIFTPYIVTITNATDSFIGGRSSAFVEFVDLSNEYTATTISNAYDYDTSTSGILECTDATGCSSSEIYEVVGEVAIPYSANINHKFHIIYRALSGNNDAMEFQIFNEDTQSWDTVEVGPTTSTEETRTLGTEISNTNGRYGQDGTGRIRARTNPGSTMAQGDTITIFDIWISTFPQSDHPLNHARLVIDTSLNDSTGGLPTGLINISINADQSVNDAADVWPQRNYFLNLSNDANQSFNGYLLRIGDGANVLFNALDGSFNVLSNVLVIGQRNLNGSFITLGEGRTGDDGTTSIFLKANFLVRIIASRAGFGTLTLSITPTAGASFNLNMKSDIVTGFVQVLNDVSYLFDPRFSFIQGGANASVNMTVSAPNSNLNDFAFNITHDMLNGSEAVIFTGTSSSPGGGILSASLNLSNATEFDKLIISAIIKKLTGEEASFGRTYTVLTTTPSNSSVFTVLNDLKTQTSFFNIQLIALFVAVMVAGFMRLGGLNSYGTGFIMLAVLGAFVFVGFFDIVIYSVMVLLVIGVYVIKEGGRL